MVSKTVHSSDVYKLFLQAAMSRRVMPERVANLLSRKCTEAVASADPTKDIQLKEWDLFTDKVKRMLDPFDLELRYFVDEDTAVRMYAIVNTRGDEVSQLASDYNPTEIAFFKAVVEQIVLAPNYSFSVSSLAALREVTHLKTSMTKAQGETVLASFVARGWLVRSQRGRYSLGTRSLLELGAFLANAYDETDLLECTVCSELVTKGFRCATPNCKTQLHRHCHEGYRRSKDVCPSCQQQWGADGKGLLPIGEAAVKAGQDERRRTRRTSGGDGDGEDIDASQDTSQTLSHSQTQRTKSQSQTKKGKGKKTTFEANGKSRKRNATPEEADELDDMYADDDDTMDIDNLARIRETPSRLHRRS